MTDYEKLLNPEQLAAVTAGDGAVLVLAAAGTGKTRTLVHRVCWLWERGVPLWSILLLTFTNRAAREMGERAEQLVGSTASALWSGTFHSICNRMLRRFGERLGYQRSFPIMDRDDARSLLDRCIKSSVASKKDFPKKDLIASLISSAANRGRTFADELEDADREVQFYGDKLVEIAGKYGDAKRDLGVMDFDDLLVNGLRLLQEQPDVLEFYQEKFRHVLVDEYQDTNLLQSRFVDLLAKGHGNVMAVGDDFQCIYSWRGADFRNIMDFPNRWPGCTIVKLERNYRSTPEILAVANACIEGNPEQFKKQLKAVRPQRKRPEVYFLRNGEEQSAVVLRKIRRYIAQGYAPGDIAVLYRSHFHSIELQMALGRNAFAYNITSGVGIFEQAHVKDILALLRICQNPEDELAFLRFVGLLPGVGEKTALKAWEKLGKRFDVSDETSRLSLAKALPKAAQVPFASLLPVLEKNVDDDIDGFLDAFCRQFYSAYLKKTYDNGDDREDDVRELARQIAKNNGGLEAFLAEVALLTNLDAENQSVVSDEGRIHLSTVHQAKGLEWPVVFILWACEGMFPSSKSIDNGDDSEERRLFYVAVTRAKDELVMLSPARRFLPDGGCCFCQPSRFIKELPRGALAEYYA